ncbi:hypothetical protein TELCIR_11288 [Teladorsagia circumcincta]|uniref:Ubiquinol-cytochrome C reductase hinge domain-containing protein n=1 Tax=Teladorsagia circumcincta TaxID=45464 RepID=A0A2G9U9U1_TELCI|nr:hypothetical protein TELCIR_11288 [Teladorsagia circumcincta]
MFGNTRRQLYLHTKAVIYLWPEARRLKHVRNLILERASEATAKPAASERLGEQTSEEELDWEPRFFRQLSSYVNYRRTIRKKHWGRMSSFPSSAYSIAQSKWIGKDHIVTPTVAHALQNWELIKGKRVFDVGCGTGAAVSLDPETKLYDGRRLDVEFFDDGVFRMAEKEEPLEVGVDQLKQWRDRCAEKFPHLKTALDECNARVSSRKETAETCVQIVESLITSVISNIEAEFVEETKNLGVVPAQRRRSSEPQQRPDDDSAAEERRRQVLKTPPQAHEQEQKQPQPPVRKKLPQQPSKTSSKKHQLTPDNQKNEAVPSPLKEDTREIGREGQPIQKVEFTFCCVITSIFESSDSRLLHDKSAPIRFIRKPAAKGKMPSPRKILKQVRLYRSILIFSYSHD